MVCSIVTLIFHFGPFGPVFDRIRIGLPDPLAPDDVLDLQRFMIVHDPLSNWLSDGRLDLKCRQLSAEETAPQNDLLRLCHCTSFR